MALGVILLSIGSRLSEGWASKIIMSLGSAGFVSGTIAILFSASTEKAIAEFRSEAAEQLSTDVQTTLKSETAELKSFVREIQKSLYSDDVRTVFAAGIIGIQKIWAGELDDEYLRSQESLDIFLKDGHTFFKDHIDAIADRLCDSRKSTRIMIVHPDFELMSAVASMDFKKAGSPERQRSEILDTITRLQAVASRARHRGLEITERNEFRGYHLIPTWNFFLGDSRCYLHLYRSRAYRGPLHTIIFQKTDTGLYEDMKEEIREILRDHCGTNSNLWDYSCA
ncbi:MAG TPA: hypothetical protein VEK55_12725 [Xanthobacteraceae bacterium]|nr:hypothetical protein [Xanthobacteraceae bacterium]